uniref:Uncharacterized protein n=1 Tax=viral metagenome TaxID=1070528 RepID=A0A6M3KM06_9ZZZZ
MALKDWFEQPKKAVAAVQGKRTQITVAVAMVVAFLEAFHLWSPPEWVWIVLGFAGVGFIRAGVKNTSKVLENMIKEIEMKAKLIIFAALLALSVGGMVQANGMTIWGLTEQDLNSQVAITGRVGYQYDFIEGFVGSTWRPQYEVGTNELKPPQVLSFGAVIHMRDLVDPNNPLPWIPDLLLSILPESMVAQPYFGGQGTWNLFDEDCGFYGAIIGIQSKTNADSKASFITELNYNQNFKDLEAVPDEWRLNMGFRFMF